MPKRLFRYLKSIANTASSARNEASCHNIPMHWISNFEFFTPYDSSLPNLLHGVSLPSVQVNCLYDSVGFHTGISALELYNGVAMTYPHKVYINFFKIFFSSNFLTTDIKGKSKMVFY